MVIVVIVVGDEILNVGTLDTCQEIVVIDRVYSGVGVGVDAVGMGIGVGVGVGAEIGVDSSGGVGGGTIAWEIAFWSCYLAI